MGFNNGSIFIWNWLTQTTVATLHGNMASYPALKLLSSGQLASSSPYNLINIWNLNNGLVNVTLAAKARFIEQLANGYLATVEGNNSIRIYNLQGSLASSLPVPSQDQTCLKQTAVSNKLASCGLTGAIFIWDTDTFTLNTTLNGHTNKVNAIALLVNENLVSASNDGTIKLWNVSSSSCLASLSPLNGQQLFSIKNVSNSTVVVGGLSNQIAFVNVNASRQFNLVNVVTLSCSFVNAFAITYLNILLIAMDNSKLAYYDMNTFKLRQAVYLGSGGAAFDMLGKSNKFWLFLN
jgi:WD40 repeat protein